MLQHTSTRATHRIPPIPLLQHRIGPLGGLNRCVLAVLAGEELGAAVDVEVVDHSFSNALTF